MRRRLALLTILCTCMTAYGQQPFEYDAAIDCYSCDEWNAPQKPFQIFGNTYYVGAAGLSSILIDTGDGLILLDGGLPQTAAVIAENVSELGFSAADIRLIGLSHAHYDHAGGLAALQRLSGAIVMTSAQSAVALRTGKLSGDDPQFILDDESGGFPAVTLVEEIEDGDSMSVGDVRIRANYTPGHTPGGITWSWQSCEAHRCLSVVYADSLSAVSSPDFKFSSSKSSSSKSSKGGSDGVGETLRRSIELVAKLDCDIFLAPHPFYFDLQKKTGEQGELNPFVDPQGCREYADAAMAGLNRRLESEQ